MSLDSYAEKVVQCTVYAYVRAILSWCPEPLPCLRYLQQYLFGHLLNVYVWEWQT